MKFNDITVGHLALRDILANMLTKTLNLVLLEQHHKLVGIGEDVTDF